MSPPKNAKGLGQEPLRKSVTNQQLYFNSSAVCVNGQTFSVTVRLTPNKLRRLTRYPRWMGLRKIDRRLYSIAGWLDKNPDGTYCVGLVFEPEDAPRERSTIYLPETAPDNSAPPDSFSGQGCVGSQHFAFTARLTTERNNRGHLQLNAAALEAQS